jgi:heat shock protein HslJ
MKNKLFMMLIAFFAASCGTQHALPVGDTSANSLDWNGTYQGLLPCSGCGEVKAKITLNPDLTYTYAGQADTAGPTTQNGHFTWNKKGNIIRLKHLRKVPSRFLVGENRLIPVDRSGSRIQGQANYALTKAAIQSSNDLEGKYWKLTELMGKPVSTPEHGRPAYFILEAVEHRVQGFAGCNTIMGTYTLESGNRIRFSRVASTLMACPDMQTEQGFKKVLETADNYSLNGNQLTLNKARMAPLARFELVDEMP